MSKFYDFSEDDNILKYLKVLLSSVPPYYTVYNWYGTIVKLMCLY